VGLETDFLCLDLSRVMPEAGLQARATGGDAPQDFLRNFVLQCIIFDCALRIIQIAVLTSIYKVDEEYCTQIKSDQQNIVLSQEI
jgi:hypothetical protein